MTNLFNDEEIKTICSLYQEGLSLREIARKYKSNHGFIGKLIKKNNINKRVFFNSKLLTEDDKNKICSEYIGGMTISLLVEKYNVCNASISKLLKKSKIEIRNTNVRLNLNESDVCEDYIKGLNSMELSKKYNCSQGTILNILNDNSIDRRELSDACRVYSLDEGYFDVIDSEDKAYFLGLLYADGCNTSSVTELTLGYKDKHILETFNKYLKSNRPLGIREEKYYLDKKINKLRLSKMCYRLYTNSKRVSDSLIKLGCVPAKSLILKFPIEDQVPGYLLSHFIRGYFDGDGCIHFNKIKLTKVFNLLGTKEFLEGVQDFFIKSGVERIIVKPFRGIYSINITNKKDLITIFNILYRESNPELRFKRKYDKWVDLNEYLNSK